MSYILNGAWSPLYKSGRDAPLHTWLNDLTFDLHRTLMIDFPIIFLQHRADVRFSSRSEHTNGYATPPNIVVLNYDILRLHVLREPTCGQAEYVRGIIIHELAHLVVFKHHPKARHHHGPEFAAVATRFAGILDLPPPCDPFMPRGTDAHPRKWPMGALARTGIYGSWRPNYGRAVLAEPLPAAATAPPIPLPTLPAIEPGHPIRPGSCGSLAYQVAAWAASLQESSYVKE